MYVDMLCAHTDTRRESGQLCCSANRDSMSVKINHFSPIRCREGGRNTQRWFSLTVSECVLSSLD